jgi:transposase
MAGRGQTYTKEFKDSAIQLALNSEKSVLKIAKELGMQEKTLYSWLSAHRKSHNLEIVAPAKKKSSIETLEEENRRLRKELKDVKIEREILKKAAAYFAKEAR